MQGVLAGAGEQRVVVDEERRVGTGVAVDALVVVADAEDVELGQREQPQQQHVRRGEVLELVDEQVPARALHVASEHPVGEQRLDGAVHLLVEVDRAALGQRGAVGGEQLHQPRDVVARRFDLVGVAQSEAHRCEPFEVRTDRVDVGATGPAAGEERLDEAAGVALLEERRWATAVAGEHPQPEGVERADVHVPAASATSRVRCSISSWACLL